MLGLLKVIKNNMVMAIIIGMLVGLGIGQLIDTTPLRSMVSVVAFLMVYPMMVTLDFSSLLQKGNMKLQVVTQIINFLVLPFMAYVFGLVFFPDMIYFRLAILLIALLPTSGMTVSWTVMSGGNVKEAIRMIVIGLLLGGVLAPFYISLYIGPTIAIPFMDVFRQIAIIVFIPMVLGFATQRILKRRYGAEKFHEHIKPVFPMVSTLFVVVLITFVMSLRSMMLFNNPAMIPRIIIPIVLGYAMMIVGIHFVGKWLFSYADRVALVNGTVIRSLSLSLAIALSVFGDMGPEVALVIAIAFIVQVQLAAWYVRLNMRTLPQHS